jgi:hypothetical protein
VRSITAAIAGDHEAARRVELELPETGVCSLNRSTPKNACCGDDAVIAHADAGNCCTAAEQSREAACCGADRRSFGRESSEFLRKPLANVDNFSSNKTSNVTSNNFSCLD